MSLAQLVGTKDPITEETYKKAAAVQFSSPAFEKDEDGSLTDAGGLKICEAFLNTVGKGHSLTPEQMWASVQLYHGKGKKVKVTESVWQDATWPLAKEAMSLAQLSGSSEDPITEESYKKAAAIQFSSPAFEKDEDGALTDAGGLKICGAFLNTVGKGHTLTPEQMWNSVQLFHGKG